MTKLAQSAGVALGWTTVAAAGLVEPIVGRGKHMDLYHWDGSPTNLFGPILLVFCLIWLVLTAVLSSALRPGRWRVAAWGAMLVLLPWRLLDAASDIATTPAWLTLPSSAFALGLLAIVVITWRSSWERAFERVVKIGSVVLQVLAFVGIFCLATLIWMWGAARDLNSPRQLHTETAAAMRQPVRPRIIWIVFDELSQDQVYDHRFPGLQLPAFDALAATSTMLTDVQPAGIRTEHVIPSLISGVRVIDAESTLRGNLLTKAHAQDRWGPFEPQNTVFADALRLGYSTALAGWYNPYCRIMPMVLDSCTWSYDYNLENGLVSEASFRYNFLQALGTVAASGALRKQLHRIEPIRDPIAAQPHLHVVDYEQVLNHAEADLQRPDRTFVLLHLPIPHPDGIYDRRRKSFTTSHSSYIDNLALADQCLAELRSTLEREGQWTSSVVVVTGDHSWRTHNLWRGLKKFWTDEDEIASGGGQFDGRPAYLVKLPGQTAAQRLNTPFHAIWTRQMFDLFMQKRLLSPEALATWIQQRPELRETEPEAASSAQ